MVIKAAYNPVHAHFLARRERSTDTLLQAFFCLLANNLTRRVSLLMGGRGNLQSPALHFCTLAKVYIYNPAFPFCALLKSCLFSVQEERWTQIWHKSPAMMRENGKTFPYPRIMYCCSWSHTSSTKGLQKKMSSYSFDLEFINRLDFIQCEWNQDYSWLSYCGMCVVKPIPTYGEAFQGFLGSEYSDVLYRPLLLGASVDCAPCPWLYRLDPPRKESGESQSSSKPLAPQADNLKHWASLAC